MEFAQQSAPSRKNHRPSTEPLRLPPSLPAGSIAAAMAAHLKAARPASGAEALQTFAMRFPIRRWASAQLRSRR